jgi:hypothetical protein
MATIPKFTVPGFARNDPGTNFRPQKKRRGNAALSPEGLSLSGILL